MPARVRCPDDLFGRLQHGRCLPHTYNNKGGWYFMPTSDGDKIHFQAGDVTNFPFYHKSLDSCSKDLV